jgi:uncharacterized cupin superfamily protein
MTTPANQVDDLLQITQTGVFAYRAKQPARPTTGAPPRRHPARSRPSVRQRCVRANSHPRQPDNTEHAMPKIDLTVVPERTGSNYPAPFAQNAAARSRQALGDAGGLRDFGVNLTRLPPGEWSSQRHWHTAEDELVYVLSGELTLVSDAGEQTLRAHDCATFAKNVPDGHHLINRGTQTAVYLEIGSRHDDDNCHYPDIDLDYAGASGHYTHKDGVPYPAAGE